MANIEESIDKLFEAEPIARETADKLFDLFLKNFETAEKKHIPSIHFNRGSMDCRLWC